MEVDRLCPWQPIWGWHCPGREGTTQKLQQLGALSPDPPNILIAIVPMGIGWDTTGDPVHALYSEFSKNWGHYKHMSVWKHIFKHMYVWKALTMPFSPSWKRMCSGVLLYWHLVGSAGEMGRWEGRLRWQTRSPRQTPGTLFFILVLQKHCWISTFLAGLLLAAAFAAFLFCPSCMPDSLLRVLTMPTHLLPANPLGL